jgi:hypothetical protein
MGCYPVSYTWRLNKMNEQHGDQMAKEYRFWLYDEMIKYMGRTMAIIDSTDDEQALTKMLERERIKHLPIIERMKAY